MPTRYFPPISSTLFLFSFFFVQKLEINLDDDDDILGVLSKPVDVVIANKVFSFLLFLMSPTLFFFRQRSEINQNHDEEDTLNVLSRPADVITPNKVSPSFFLVFIFHWKLEIKFPSFF